MLRKWFGKRSPSRLASTKTSPRTTLKVQCLEDRTVPAHWTVTGIGDQAGLPITSGSGTQADPYLIPSLRSCLALANDEVMFAGQDIIGFGGDTFSTPQTISLTSGLTLASWLTIDGGGHTIAPASGGVGGFNVTDTGTFVELSNVTFSFFSVAQYGAAIVVDNNGNLQATNVSFLENESIGGNGGAAYIGSAGTASFNDCLFDGNIAFEGAAAIMNDGVLRVSRSTFTNGIMEGGFRYGGAIVATSGEVTINGSLFHENHAQFGYAGALAVRGSANVSVYNSTFSKNSAGISGGAIYAEGGSLLVVNSTVVENHSTGASGGGIETFGSTLSIDNSIVALNTIGDLLMPADSDVTGEALIRFSLIGTEEGITFLTGSDDNMVGVNGSPIDPLIGDLADNGGPTLTRALLENSPAIDAASEALAITGDGPLTTDQRGTGFTRKFGAGVDIGAFEFQPEAPPPPPQVWHPLTVQEPLDTISYVGATPGELYIEDLYRTILNRAPEPGAAAGWVSILNTAGSQAVVDGIFGSREHRTIQVLDYYSGLLDRSASAEEVDGWVNAMLAGLSEQDVVRSFLLSVEFTANKTNEQFVESLYNVILFRGSDTGGLQSWVSAMSTGATTFDVWNGINFSAEHADLVLGDFYTVYLGRPADDAGLANWRSVYVSQTISEPAIAKFFLASPEFADAER